MQSREDEIQYLADHGIPFEAGHDNSYSRDRNLWHLSHEGLELEDPANEPNYEHIFADECNTRKGTRSARICYTGF